MRYTTSTGVRRRRIVRDAELTLRTIIYGVPLLIVSEALCRWLDLGVLM